MRVGIYEKALHDELDWPARCDAVAELGFDFLEISVDPSPQRLARLEWSKAQRREIVDAQFNSGVPIYAIVLSAHRAFPLGTANVALAARGRAILSEAIALASDLGIRIVQLAGYFSQPDEPQQGTRDRFLDALHAASEQAANLGVMLALENVDGRDVTSIREATQLVEEVGSPWLAVYADVGNSAANGHDLSDVEKGRAHMVGVHLKDTRPGEFRRVAFGTGTVDFPAALSTLRRIGYQGPLLLEMWSDNQASWRHEARIARDWLNDLLAINRVNVDYRPGPHDQSGIKRL